MRSKTSFFNATLFWKTVARFWPIWFIYAFVWAIFMPIFLGSSLNSAIRYSSSTAGIVNALQSLPLEMGLYGATIISFIACCFSAMAVFSHLYSMRSAGAYAALPIKRQGVFTSVTLAGILPLLAINLATFAATLIVEAAQGPVYLPALLQWLAMVSLINIFFYGFAVLCAQMTGNLIVLPLVYAVLNLTVYVVEELIKYILRIFVFGFSSSGFSLSFLSPVIYLCRYCSINSTSAYHAASDSYQVTGYYFSGWGTVIAYAVAGLVLIAAGLLLYKRRRMETAGDVVAVRWLRPIFKYCLSLGCALCIGLLLFSILRPDYSYGGTPMNVLVLTALMIVGCFIGYFAAEMLIHKSFAVWRGRRRWLGFLVASAVITVLTFSCEFDLFGYEKKVPAADNIEQVSLRVNGDNSVLTEPQNIGNAVALHNSIIGNKAFHESSGDGSAYMYMEYTLRDGTVIKRAYSLNYDTDGNADDVIALQNLVNTQEAINYRKQLSYNITAENINYAYVSFRTLEYDEYGGRSQRPLS